MCIVDIEHKHEVKHKLGLSNSAIDNDFEWSWKIISAGAIF